MKTIILGLVLLGLLGTMSSNAQKLERDDIRFTAWVRFLEVPELAKSGDSENPWSFVRLRITAFVKGDSELRTLGAYQMLYPHSMYHPRLGDSLCVTVIKSPTLVKSRLTLGKNSPWKSDYMIDPSDQECYRATNPRWID